MRLSLRWQGLTHTLESCRVLAHPVDDAGRIWGQKRNQPQAGL